jgi:hypothetical protein
MNTYELKALNHCINKNFSNEKCYIFFLQMGISSDRTKMILDQYLELNR